MNKIYIVTLLLFFLSPILSGQNDTCTLEVVYADYPTLVRPGEIIIISATIQNTSGMTSEPTNLGLYQRIGGRSVPVPRLIDVAGKVPAIAPYQSVYIQFQVTLPVPFYNTNLGDYFFSVNNLLLLFKEDAENLNAVFRCNFPVEVEIKYEEVDLEVKFSDDTPCFIEPEIYTEPTIAADLVVTNLGSQKVKAPIVIALGKCSFISTIRSCSGSGLTYWTIEEDLPSGESVVLPNPFRYAPIRRAELESNRGGLFGALMETASNVVDINPSNNRAAFDLDYLDTAPDCSETQNTQRADCVNLTFVAGNNQIEVQNLNATFSQIQIIGQNTDWQVLTICNGDCDENQVIPDLAAGEYTVKVQLNSTDGSDCYREESVTIGGNSNNNNSDGVNCDDLIFSGEVEQITVSGLLAASEKVEIIGQNTNWQIVEICNGNCGENQIIPNLQAGEYAVKVNQFGSDGSYCYREERVTVVNDEENSNNNDGAANCVALQFTTPLSEQILVAGLDAAYNKVEIIGAQTNWEVRTICDGDCEEEQTIFPLNSGAYTVKVSQVGADGQFCYRGEKLQVFVSGSSRSTQDVSEEITLFPNPVKSIFYLDLNRLADKTGQINIFNSYGQIVQQLPNMTFSKELTPINVSELDNGLYYLTIQAENTRLITKRFVVESYK